MLFLYLCVKEYASSYIEQTIYLLFESMFKFIYSYVLRIDIYSSQVVVWDSHHLMIEFAQKSPF